MVSIVKIASICIFILVVTAQATEFYPDWSDIDTPPFPLMSAVPNNPVITAEDVTDESACFVADPFLFYEDGLWYMFFEAALPKGVVCLATSADGVEWTYKQMVLVEGWHLSFPFVFKYDGCYYMMPESSTLSEVNLYEGTKFPYGWEPYTTLVSGREFIDPVLLHHGDTWWLFVGVGGSQYLHLYFSDHLVGPWTEHPMSPIVNSLSKARPAGRFVVYNDDRIIRLGQKCDVSYGEAVRAFEIDVLTRTTYIEHEIPESPLLQASGSGWNAAGMHQCDAWWNGSHWLAVVDGCESDCWSIGIYQTEVSTGVPSASDPRWAADAYDAIHLSPNSPNPICGRTEIPYAVDHHLAHLPGRLNIYGIADGRLIRTNVIPRVQPNGSIVWNGADTSGRPVSAGVYRYELQVGEMRCSRQMVVVR
ncbi:hypothetical protein ACFL6M_00085 [Candidatus Eisenbacteria bacterium]|uniref:Glucosamine inositolphosphorylceramide transferase 1 N-terminal domain-containing protein n=1 Tax=Eiseniibacteriota bacterium TaxID=2212470 RepID=A0ABV6YIG7_UNCEI